MNNIKKLICNNLRKYRVWKGITQKQLSIELQISVIHLRNIECNNKYPKYQIRAKLCKYFNINQDQMFFYNKNNYGDNL
jgi:DNA-binding XRE family transcriptional regulator